MIIPAILEKDIIEIKNKVQMLQDECSLFQIDVADGSLVNGSTFLSVKSLDQIDTDSTFELDLMVKNPQDYVKQRILSVFKVCTYIKANSNVEEFIKRAKSLDYITGISVDSLTDISEIEKYISDIDYIQFMGVEPGGQGRPFDKKIINKVKEVKDLYSFIDIQIDGGVNFDTLLELKKLGIKDFVIGSAIFADTDPINKYKKFKEFINEQ